jgi:hypothetical protein
MRGLITKVIVVGFPIVMKDLVILYRDLHNNKSYDNNPHRQKGKKKEENDSLEKPSIEVMEE